MTFPQPCLWQWKQEWNETHLCNSVVYLTWIEFRVKAGCVEERNVVLIDKVVQAKYFIRIRWNQISVGLENYLTR